MGNCAAVICNESKDRAIGLITLNHADSAEQITLQETESQLETITEAQRKIRFDCRNFVGNKENAAMQGNSPIAFAFQE